MEETLAEQLMRSCKHFTGLGEKTCKVGMSYSQVRDRAKRTISCLKMDGSLMGHNELCVKQEFLTLEEAEEAVLAIRERDKKIDAGICPDCDGKLEDQTRKSGRYKGHGKIICPACEKAVVII